MFKLSFTRSDLVRAFWAFVGGAVAFYLVQGKGDWKSVVAGAVTAGLVSVKNLLLADGSAVKG